jgi:C-22 sterol desaturase
MDAGINTSSPGNQLSQFPRNGSPEYTYGILPAFFSGWSSWQIILTTILVLITYDQSMYQWRKGSIAGPAFKIPFMGPFIQALHPNFNEYLIQWRSGALSCVSVFHKYVCSA